MPRTFPLDWPLFDWIYCMSSWLWLGVSKFLALNLYFLTFWLHSASTLRQQCETSGMLKLEEQWEFPLTSLPGPLSCLPLEVRNLPDRCRLTGQKLLNDCKFGQKVNEKKKKMSKVNWVSKNFPWKQWKSQTLWEGLTILHLFSAQVYSQRRPLLRRNYEAAKVCFCSHQYSSLSDCWRVFS